MKPRVRWMLISLSGSIGLLMLAAMGSEFRAEWSKPNSYFVEQSIIVFFGLLFAGPWLVITTSLLRRKDPQAVELMSLILAVMSFFAWTALMDLLAAKNWLVPGDGHFWEPVKTTAAFVLASLPFIVPVVIYRLCRKLGSQYLLGMGLRDQ